MTILLYIVVGLAIGGISGLMGIGGGVLLVPAFVWIFGFGHREAVGTTLAIMVPPIGLLAALEYYRRGEVNLLAAAIIAIAFTAGAFGGAKLVPFLPVQLLRMLFGLMLLYIAVRFTLFTYPEAESAFFGLLASGFGWLAFFGLRILGRRYLPPNLGDQIRAMHKPEQTGTDYYI